MKKVIENKLLNEKLIYNRLSSDLMCIYCLNLDTVVNLPFMQPAMVLMTVNLSH